jgi:Co/Zn/Cd efflux system component
MLGDSATMFVDAFTYLANMVAEKKKQTTTKSLLQSSSSSSTTTPTDEQDSKKRRQLEILKLELLSPAFSVVTLILVTLYIVSDSLDKISDEKQSQKAEANGGPSNDDTTNVAIMLVFSSLNLIIDFVNVGFFAAADHGLGYNVRDRVTDDEEEGADHEHCSGPVCKDCENKGLIPQDAGGSDDGTRLDQELGEDLPSSSPSATSSSSSSSIPSNDIDLNDKNKANMNMCSAYTHVFADTLRSIAVLCAALYANLTETQGDLTDAYAALAVSIIIVLSTVPLIKGLGGTWGKYLEVRREVRGVEGKNGLAMTVL